MMLNVQTGFETPIPLLASKNLTSSFSLFRSHVSRRNLRFKSKKSFSFTIQTRASSLQSTSNSVEGEDADSVQLFETWKDAERERANKLEELARKSELQLERQLVMASDWSRALLKMRGKLKGTEWDPVNSHMIDYSDFMKLLNSNNVQYMEYSNYGQNVSVILPDYNEGDPSDNKIIYKRHMVDRMPVDCWNDVWKKLHQQIVNVDVINVNTVPKGVYCTIATVVVWSMRLAVSIALYMWIDSKMRPIYSKESKRKLDIITKTKKVQQQRQVPKKIRTPIGSIGKSRALFISAEQTTGVTFDDFAGQDYIKEELKEIVRILKNDEQYRDRGIYCPRGVLLHGPPGTGKTLLAKAIAGEAGLPFFAANGTDFVEMFVGVAAARVKDLFTNARSCAPCIIFIDEIDAIGSKRGGRDPGGGGAEREQGLLQILTEMDGFKVDTSQVLTIGATNRLDILDPALLRKGRFDKVIRVGLPSRDGRLAILKVHARNKFFRSEEEKESLLQEIADRTDNFSGAELQNILNEAGILTARKNLDAISPEEIYESLKRQKGTFETGQEDRREIPEEIRLRLAYREAAIAIISCYYPDPYRPFTKTNIKSIQKQPNMRYVRKPGRVFKRKGDFVLSIVRECAPKVIEEQVFGVENLSWISSDATNKAARLAEFLILQTGFTVFGKAYYRTNKDLLPSLYPKVEALRDEYIRFGVEKCASVLKEFHHALETVTDTLLEKKEMTADEIWEVFNNSPRIPQDDVGEIDEYGALIYAGRWGIHGASLPGRVTFAPGNVGFATFGAPRPILKQIINDETWQLVDEMWDKNVEELEKETIVEEEDTRIPQLLMATHFL